MGQRYSKLPSELLLQADTFDLMVMDVSLRYQIKMNNKQKGIIDQSDYDQEDLQRRLRRARNED